MRNWIAGALSGLFEQGGFSPHAFCLAYDDFALSGMILGHRLVELAYFAVPIQLAYAMLLVMRGWTLRVSHPLWMIALMSAVFLSCGIGHRIEETNFYEAFYRLEAAWLIWTGFISIVALIALPFLVKWDRPPSTVYLG